MTMTHHLIDELHRLSRAEKLKAMEILMDDLKKEEVDLVVGKQYDVWSPFDSASAASILRKMLEENEDTDV
jgi:hypothetical protein